MDNNEEARNENREKKHEKKQESTTKKIIDILSTVLIAAVIALLLNKFVFSLIEVNMTSMYPTVNNSDVVFLNKTAYWFGGPESGDIIVFEREQSNDSQTKNYIKRVIGVPGDTIEITNGNVYRNGVLLDEPYLIVTTNGSYHITVPENKYFVMGDNRTVSVDSRSPSIGFVDKSEILGRVVFKTKPFGTIPKYKHDYADVK